MISLGKRVRSLGAAAVLLAATMPARAGDVPTGRLIETVACAADATQTYALYVPTSFDPTRTWPVIFCFDPGARGRVPVERFMAAAEKFGYIVAGSNNSRNGPWAANANAINLMIHDVDRVLPLDRKRIYAAGLSGGARTACQVAVAGVAHGVIACSGGFMNRETPAEVRFPFFGAAGLQDFNYLELREVDRDLAARHAPHRVLIHAGGHEWLPPEFAMEALAWLDLQAMRSGAKPKDAEWIAAQFAARLAAVPAQPAAENFRALESLVADFGGLVDVSECEKKITALGAAREVREALKAERAAERREQSVTDDLLGAVRDGFTNEVRKTSAELRVKATLPEGSPERQMATRVLQGVYISCAEPARELLRNENYDGAAPLLEMMTLLQPDRPQAFFDLARCRAHRGDRKKALAALQQAAAAGFKDVARIEAESAFAPLRSEPAFLDLLRAMRGRP
ncbi:MAG TPA: tetratricopeptide repeat protein [Opitutaceae bacterium]|nr:tetratricopeptide repeat protein [Opitutaceae bacterium]